MSSIFSSVSLDGVASVMSQMQAMRESAAVSALGRGAGFLSKKNYERAIAEFKLAASLQPDLTEAHTYLGKTLSFLGRNEEAVAAYEKAVRLNPTDVEMHTNLAGAYVAVQQYGKAEEQYKAAARLAATDPSIPSAQGYLYMLQERYSEAETQFQRAITLAPRDASSYYQLGLVYSKQNRYEDAVEQFQSAIRMDGKYTDAYYELAYAYVGLGDTDHAQQQANELWQMNTAQSTMLAAELEATMYTPQIWYANTADSTFNPYLTVGAPLSALDASLATPNASKVFSMVFQFNQDMDIASVQNVANWTIRKATGGDGGVYNHGMSLDYSREISISPMPISVRYNPTTGEATVYFRVTQNADGDGTIDPSHWIFKFTGTDANGNPMDPAADEYDGFARGVF